MVFLPFCLPMEYTSGIDLNQDNLFLSHEVPPVDCYLKKKQLPIYMVNKMININPEIAAMLIGYYNN